MLQPNGIMLWDGKAEPDPELRGQENGPLKEDWQAYFACEVAPFLPDAWVDKSVRDDKDRELSRVGYEISFDRSFYKEVPPRPLEKIGAEFPKLEAGIASLLKEIAA